MLDLHQGRAEDGVSGEGGTAESPARSRSAPLGQRELSEALALREQALGILGHELRNPLSAILALARGTMRRPDLADDVRERLLQMDLAARRSLALIDSLHDFSEGRWRGPLRLRTQPVDPAAIAASIIDEFRAAHAGRDIALDVRSSAIIPLDPLRIGQLLSNLIGNALMHGFAHTPVRVDIEVGNDEAVLAVRNQGEPIAPDRLAQLFEPFTQGGVADADLDGARDLARERPRGLGLGLYIVQLIVTAHGGTVTVDSRADTGTTFRVRLPRR